jgi:molecular chaperone DnaK (HSP70)
MKMKKLITMVAVCMMASFLPVMAGTPKGTDGADGNKIKNAEERMTPEQRTAKIEEHIKRLEEHKARATSNGRTEVVNAIQGMIDALNNLKGVVGSKDRDSIKGAMEQVKTARVALQKLIPEKAKENRSKGVGERTGKKQGGNGL